MKRRSNSWASIYDASLLETVEGELEKRRLQISEQQMRMKMKWRGLITGDEDKRIRDSLDEIKTELRNEAKKLETKAKITISKAKKTIIESQKRPSDRQSIDKIGFTAGVAGLFFCQYVLLVHPQRFWQLYLAVLPLLMILKLGYYKTLGWEYFLLDFCYFCNIGCCLLCFWLYMSPADDSQLSTNYLSIPSLFKACFISATGPVAMAVPAWGFSLVFHDFDKVNSSYIHLLPMLLMYVMRWAHTAEWNQALASTNTNTYSAPAVHPNQMAARAHAILEAPSLTDLTLRDHAFALSLYLAWQAMYIFITESKWALGPYLDQHPELLTSLRCLTTNSKNGMHRLVLRVCRRTGLFARDELFVPSSAKTLVVFVVSQLLYTILTQFVVATLMYRSYGLHTAFVVGISLLALYNGASYYIEVFATRYTSSLEQKWEQYQAIREKVKQSESEQEGEEQEQEQEQEEGQGEKEEQEQEHAEIVAGSTGAVTMSQMQEREHREQNRKKTDRQCTNGGNLRPRHCRSKKGNTRPGKP